MIVRLVVKQIVLKKTLCAVVMVLKQVVKNSMMKQENNMNNHDS